MDGSLRATCPRCRSSLRIPAQWVGQTVKCKKCGAVVRSKLKPGVTIPDGGEMDSEIVEGLPVGALPTPDILDDPAGSPFDDMGKPGRSGLDNPFDSHHDAHPPQHLHDLNGFDPATAHTSPDHPMAGFGPQPGYDPAAAGYAPPPGYPYPMPPGYAPPAGYAPPPGYPYPMPPGYGYPVPPGYAPPAAYAPPPGYPYPMPPGYGPPTGYAPPPGYTYPAAYPQPAPVAAPVAAPVPPPPAAPVAAPRRVDPVPESSVFKSEEPLGAAPARRRHHRAGPGNTLVWVGLCVLLTCGLVAGGIYLKNANSKKTETGEKHEKDHKDHKETPKDTKGTKGGTTPGTTTPAGTTASSMPRRMLFVHVSNYMFMNSLTAAAESGSGSRGPDLVKPSAARFAFEWRIPDRDPSQLYVLADTLQNTESRPVLKSVLTGTYEKFFDTSRTQDRILVYFGGHAVEVEGKAYMVPAEGALDEIQTLIPLDDFYAKLKDCKATQKVVIWDVCRFNFQRGKQGPGSEPMTESLHKALAAAPPGVQAVITASPGQNALEFFDLQPDGMPQRGKGITSVAGSNFLESMRHVAEKGKLTNRTAAGGDPLPVAAWVEAINKRAGEVATFASQSAGAELKQTVTLHGSAPDLLVAHDPAAPPPAKFEIPQPPRGASSGEIGSIETEYNVPPFKPDLQVPSLAMFPFTEEAIKDFAAKEPLDDLLKDKEKNKFVATVYNAYQVIREVWTTGVDGSRIRSTVETTDGKVTDATKKDIKTEQDLMAVAIAKLELVMIELIALEKMKADQPKRWQAHYDYALALLKARMAYLNEYNLLLGNVHTDTLPAIDPKQGHVGVKLVTTEKMKSKKDVLELAKGAVELFEKIIKDYPGTPWAMQAKREKGIPLGLQWQPYSAGEK